MATKIAGFVLRAIDRVETSLFYSELGLNMNEHKHGNGPRHNEFGPLSEDCVVEVYLRTVALPKDALMVEVDSIEVALKAAAKFRIQRQMRIKDLGDFKFVYITDPDGRSLMLIEKKWK